jgi:hypothetical protein
VKSASAKINGFKSELASLQNDPFVELIGFQIQSFREYSEKNKRVATGLPPGVQIVEDEEYVKREKEQAIKEKDERILREAYYTKPDQLVQCMPGLGIKVLQIEKCRDETRVTLSVRIKGDLQWLRFDSGFCIIDKESKDRYFIRRLDRNLPLDKTIIVSGMSGQTVGITLVFPPLKRSVKEVDIEEFITPGAEVFSTHQRYSFRNLELKKLDDKQAGEIYK